MQDKNIKDGPNQFGNNCNEDKIIPPEIYCFNWGACLLSLIWCIRYGVWFGLLALIPIFGFMVPIALGFYGNVWAWKKNNFNNPKEFLLAQRRWGQVGAVIWLLLIMSPFVIYKYIFHEAYLAQEQAIDIINHNKRALDYFGTNIVSEPDDFGEYKYFNKFKFATLELVCNVHGSKSSGKIECKMIKIGGHWITYLLSIILDDDQDKTIKLIDMYIEQTVNKNESLDITKILNEIIELREQDEFVIVIRSRTLNDYMQARIKDLNDPNPRFIIQYSNGFNKGKNKELFKLQDTYIADAEFTANVFQSYMSGKDDCMKQWSWERIVIE